MLFLPQDVRKQLFTTAKIKNILTHRPTFIFSGFFKEKNKFLKFTITYLLVIQFQWFIPHSKEHKVCNLLGYNHVDIYNSITNIHTTL